MRKKSIRLEDRMFGHVESCRDIEDSRGRPRHIVGVRTVNGLLDLKFWNVDRRDSFPAHGEFLGLKIDELGAAQAELDNWGTLSADSVWNKPYYCEFSVLNEEDVPDEVRRVIRKDRGVQRSRCKEILTDPSYWKNPLVHEFLLSFVGEHSERFASVPAAVEKHHAYRGGLFIHSCEVFCNCVGLARSPMNEYYDSLDTDALYLAAWFHDMGKMEVYRMEGDRPVMDSEMENRIGHPTISDRMFLAAARDRGFEESFMNLVSHCILSHHNRPKWGSVVRPDAREAQILCQSDWLSSRNV